MIMYKLNIYVARIPAKVEESMMKMMNQRSRLPQAN